MRRFCLVALVTVAVGAPVLPALGQESPPPAPAAKAPDAASLPAIEVVGKKQGAAKKKQTAKQGKSAPKAKSVVPATPSPQPQAQPTPPTPGQSFDNEIKAATGPVDGYVAGATATATKTATPVALTPQSISVVTADRMRDQAAYSVESALRYVPGVNAEPYGFDSRGDYTTVRGTTPTQFLDGLKRGFYFYDFGKPDPFELERIEVLRGPASNLYGQHTSGGLINMISKRPQQESQGEIGVEYGSYDRKRVEFDTTGAMSADGRWLYRLVGVAHEGETQMDFTDNSRLLLAPSLTFKPQAGTTFTVLGHLQSDTASSSTLGFFPNKGTLTPGDNGRRISTSTNPSNPDFDRYDTDNRFITVLADHRVNDVLSLHQSARYTEFELTQRGLYPDIYSESLPFLDPYIDPAGTQVNRFIYATDAKGQIWNSDTRAELKLSTGPIKHRVLVGYDYVRYALQENYREDFDDTPFNVFDPNYTTTPPIDPNSPDFFSQITDQVQTSQGVYLQDQFRLGPLLATAGVRFDQVEDRDPSVGKDSKSATSQRYALIYETGNGFNPYVSFGQSFEPVAGQDINGAFFKPIIGEIKEIGFKYQVAPKTLISGAIYQLDEENRLSTDPTNPNFSVQLGQTRVEGFELEALVGVTSNFNLIANYAYTDAKITSGDDAGSVIFYVPEHLASFWGVYKFDSGYLKNVSIGAGVRYVGVTGEDYWEAPGVTLFDAMIAYDTDHWRWALNGSNLEDEVHIAGCDPRGDCFYGQRLNVTTSLSYKF